MFVRVKVNSARYIARDVNHVFLTFLQQEGAVLFQQDNARAHTAVAMQCALRDVQQMSWQTRSPGLLPIEHILDMMKRELILSPESATTGPRCLGQFIAG